jgi:hypothetical protein
LKSVSVSLQPSWDDKCLWFPCMMQGCIITGFCNLRNCKMETFMILNIIVLHTVN